RRERPERRATALSTAACCLAAPTRAATGCRSTCTCCATTSRACSGRTRTRGASAGCATACAHAATAIATTASAAASGGRWLVGHALSLAAVALELGFNPCDRVAIALRAFLAIAERREALDRGLVLLEIEPVDKDLDRIRRRRGLRGLLCAANRAAVPASTPIATKALRRKLIAFLRVLLDLRHRQLRNG